MLDRLNLEPKFNTKRLKLCVFLRDHSGRLVVEVTQDQQECTSRFVIHDENFVENRRVLRRELVNRQRLTVTLKMRTPLKKG